MPDANGVPVSWRTNLVAVAAGLAALGAGAPHSAAAQRDFAPDAYGGLAAWVDMYDREPWERPERTMSDLAGRGVETVFVQTSNYRQRRDLHRPAALSRMLAAADRVNVRTVAWYLPGFDRPRRDWHRMRAALDFVAAEGQHFDGFALDIEATAVPISPSATGGCSGCRTSSVASPARTPRSGRSSRTR